METVCYTLHLKTSAYKDDEILVTSLEKVFGSAVFLFSLPHLSLATFYEHVAYLVVDFPHLNFQGRMFVFNF